MRKCCLLLNMLQENAASASSIASRVTCAARFQVNSCARFWPACISASLLDGFATRAALLKCLWPRGMNFTSKPLTTLLANSLQNRINTVCERKAAPIWSGPTIATSRLQRQSAMYTPNLYGICYAAAIKTGTVLTELEMSDFRNLIHTVSDLISGIFYLVLLIDRLK